MVLEGERGDAKPRSQFVENARCVRDDDGVTAKVWAQPGTDDGEYERWRGRSFMRRQVLARMSVGDGVKLYS